MFLNAVSPNSNLYISDCLLHIGHVLELPMSHTLCNLEKDFHHGTNLKKKTKYFSEKQFALLGFACIPSTITVDYMSLKMSFLPCNPLCLILS